MTTDAPARYVPQLRDLPSSDRPRERLKQYGAVQLTDAEIIAILLRTGLKGENVLTLANRLLNTFGGVKGLLKTSLDEMCDIRGISEAKACQVIAGLDLGRRAAIPAPDRPVIRSSKDVYDLVSGEMQFLQQEHLRALMLNTKNEVVATAEIYRGTVNTASVRVAEVIRPAVRGNYPSIVVVHNHPSGDPSPSSEDILVTRRIRQSAEMMDIELLDHVVIGEQKHVSMKTLGLGF